MVSKKNIAMNVGKALIFSNWISVSLDPGQLKRTMKEIVSNQSSLEIMANKTGIPLHNVTHVLLSLYSCINNKTSSNQTYGVWSCFPFYQDMPAAGSTPGETCKVDDLTGSLNFAFFALGMILLVLMSWFRKRKRCLLGCCFGRPGCVIPLNMLDSYENRFGNALAFGATTNTCCLILVGDYNSLLGTSIGGFLFDPTTPSFFRALANVFVAICIATAFYPMFACMMFDNKVVGSIVGFLYTLLWLLAGLLRTDAHYICLGRSFNYTLFVVFAEMPGLLCLILLLFKFLIMFYWAMVRWNKLRREKTDMSQMTYGEIFSDWREHYLYKHVKNLLTGSKYVSPDLIAPEDRKVCTMLRQKVYRFKPEFKYSTRIICSFAVACYATYVLVVVLIGMWFTLGTQTLMKIVHSPEFVFFFNGNIAFMEEVRDALDALHVAFYVAIGCAVAIFSSVIANMITWYRGHIMRLRKGDRRWLPTSVQKGSISPASLTASSVKYAGFQIAYCTWGVVVLVVSLWIIFFIIGWQMVIPISRGTWSFTLTLLYGLWPALLLTLLINIGQYFCAKYIFLYDSGTSFSIDNRNAFHVISFYMFFFNVALGLLSCLLRIFWSVGFGVLFLGRLQKSLLPRSLEKIDPGYMSYVGYVMQEHSHANPVLCVFFTLLHEHAQTLSKGRTKEEKMQYIVGNISTVEGNVASSRSNVLQKRKRWLVARNRWHLALTLLRNPHLRKYRNRRDPFSTVNSLLRGLHNRGFATTI